MLCVQHPPQYLKPTQNWLILRDLTEDQHRVIVKAKKLTLRELFCNFYKATIDEPDKKTHPTEKQESCGCNEKVISLGN